VTTLLTFYYGSTSITFDDQELHRVEINHYQKINLTRLQNGQPILTKLSGERREAVIDLKPAYISTAEDVETLIALTNVMGMRLDNLAGTQQELFAVVIDPNAETFYIGGSWDGGTIMRIRAIESTSVVIPIDIYNDIIGVA